MESNTPDLYGEMVAEILAGADRGPYVHSIHAAGDDFDRFDAIRKFYVHLWPRVRELPAYRWALDPNEVRFRLSPIEELIWSDLREEGVVMYPQHPVGRYFVDFGHPKAKVAIECDGAEFHQDFRKDRERQSEIEARGWTVFRLTGAQCHRGCGVGLAFDPDTDQEVAVYSEARKLIQTLGRDYGLSYKHMTRKAA